MTPVGAAPARRRRVATACAASTPRCCAAAAPAGASITPAAISDPSPASASRTIRASSSSRRIALPSTRRSAVIQPPSRRTHCAGPSSSGAAGMPKPSAPAAIRTGGASPSRRNAAAGSATWCTSVSISARPPPPSTVPPRCSRSAGTGPSGVATRVPAPTPSPFHSNGRLDAAKSGEKAIGRGDRAQLRRRAGWRDTAGEAGLWRGGARVAGTKLARPRGMMRSGRSHEGIKSGRFPEEVFGASHLGPGGGCKPASEHLLCVTAAAARH